MAVCRFSFGVVAVVAAFVFVLVMPAAVQAQSPAPAPAPTSGSDGTSVDQGVAYLLMLVALVLTYLIHSADVSSGY